MPFLCIHIVLALPCQDHLLFPASAVLHREVAGCRGEHWRVLGCWEEEVEDGSMGLVVRSWGALPCRSITRADSSYGKCSGKQLRGCNSSRGSHWDTAFTAEGNTWRRVTEKENVYYFPLQDNSFYLCFFGAEIVNNNFQSENQPCCSHTTCCMRPWTHCTAAIAQGQCWQGAMWPNWPASIARAAQGGGPGQPQELCRRCAEVTAGAWELIVAPCAMSCKWGNWAGAQVFTRSLERGVGRHRVGGLQAGFAGPGRSQGVARWEVWERA